MHFLECSLTEKNTNDSNRYLDSLMFIKLYFCNFVLWLQHDQISPGSKHIFSSHVMSAVGKMNLFTETDF